MIAAWWFQAVVISTALALAAWGAERILAAWSLPRRWAWVAAALGTVLLVVASPFRNSPAGPEITPQAVAAAPSAWSRAAALPARLGTITFPDVDTPLGLIWLGSAVVGLAYVSWSLHRLAARVRHAPEVDLHGTTVRLTPDDGPMVVGLRTPEIVVPEALLRRHHRDVQLVLAHEESHRAARDPLLLALSTWLVALMPGLPALWYMRARLRVAIEIDCDHRVIATHRTDRARYGELLLALASRRTLTAPLPMGLSLHPSSLERRLVAMTARPNRRWLPLLVLPAAIGTFVACQAPLPTTESERADLPQVRLDGVQDVPQAKLAGEPLELEIRPDQSVVELVIDDTVRTRQMLRRSQEVELVEVQIVPASPIEVRVDDSKRVPLLRKGVEKQ